MGASGHAQSRLAHSHNARKEFSVTKLAGAVCALVGVGVGSNCPGADHDPGAGLPALVDGRGRAVRLRGVNRAAFESRCTYDGSDFADGPVDQASVTAMKSWKINVVRLTINEDCWLGVNGLTLGGNAAGYRRDVLAYVSLCEGTDCTSCPCSRCSVPAPKKATQIDQPAGQESHALVLAEPCLRSAGRPRCPFRPGDRSGHGRLERPRIGVRRLHDRLRLRRTATLRGRRPTVAGLHDSLDGSPTTHRPRGHRLTTPTSANCSPTCPPPRHTNSSHPRTSTTSSRGKTSDRSSTTSSSRSRSARR